MKKYLTLCLLFFFSFTIAEACDVCGCSLGGNYFGLLPVYNKNFIGLRWSQAKFHAFMNHDSEYFQNEYSNDTYSKLELWGRFKISNRVQLFAFVPYSYNNMNGSIQKVKASGLGDITILANYKMFQTADETAKIRQMMTLGGGIKAPTGEFRREDQDQILNRNFQLGTGSVDFLVNAVYTIRYRSFGFNTESGYKMNTRNGDDYRFGNQFNISSQFFYSRKAGGFTFLPNTGMYYEQAAKHQDGNNKITNTGGNATFLSAGLETYFKGFSVGVNYKRPLTQHYNSDDIADITTKDRWTLSLTYSF